MGTNDTARSNLSSIRKGDRALEVAVKDSGAQAVFSSILPAKAKRFEMAESGESTNDYRTGATARGSASSELCVVGDTLEGRNELKG